jgi:hypothetical protein
VARILAILGVLLAVGLLPGCEPERATLEVSLTPPVASRFIVHGNCFAGWLMAFDLVIRERQGVDVTIQSVAFRVEDDTGFFREWTISAGYLQQRSRTLGAGLPGRTERSVPTSAYVGDRVERPSMRESIVISGEVLASDEHGSSVRASFRIPTTMSTDESPIPRSGACNEH